LFEAHEFSGRSVIYCGDLVCQEIGASRVEPALLAFEFCREDIFEIFKFCTEKKDHSSANIPMTR
jgi:hypothetical protein